MRRIGTLDNHVEAQRFHAFLLTVGIESQVDNDGSSCEVWIKDEDQLQAAMEHLEEFRHNASGAKYVSAEQEAKKIEKEKLEKARKARENVVTVRQSWGSPNAPKRRPVTLALVFSCIVIGLLTGLISGSIQYNDITNTLLFTEARAPRDASFQELSDVATYSLKKGEVWRLITPIFLHGSILHIAMNLYMLFWLGSQVENALGSWKYLGLIVFCALLSNCAQAFLENPNFVGISGVVFGLFGAAWMLSMYKPESGVFISSGMVMFAILWIVLGFAGILDQLFGGNTSLANWAHLGGLIAGMIFCGARHWLKT